MSESVFIDGGVKLASFLCYVGHFKIITVTFMLRLAKALSLSMNVNI